MNSFLHVRISALAVAEACLSWGARLCTTQILSGLNRHTVTQLAKDAATSMPRGRPMDAERWYVTADLAARIEACVLVSQFCRLRSQRYCPTDSLLSAYKSVFQMSDAQPKLQFDQAFDLAAQADDQWIYGRCWLALSECKRCGCQYISSLRTQVVECPFCEILTTYMPERRAQLALSTPRTTFKQAS